MMALRRFLATAFAVSAVLAGCGSSGSSATGSCLDDPTACPTGQTCWPVSATPTFACIASTPKGAFGVTCENTIGAATCADALACDAVVGASAARCTYYCDIAKGKTCPPSYDCVSTQSGGSNGPMIQICRIGSQHGTPVPVVDSGSDAPFIEDASPGDASNDAAPANQ